MECTRQYQSTDVKVWDNHTARTLSFGKETTDQAIQQGNARVSNGIQQDVGELAAHSCPLERKGNPGAPSQRQQYITKYGTPQSLIVANQPSLTLSNTFRVIYPPDHGAAWRAVSISTKQPRTKPTQLHPSEQL
ncbi:hypothetical protein R3P38DRAFT_3371645 [Favolaschia claudopus]|uniref:Uncharacterized protein n=1 Tax=Favolaschia claudopus TaxID=2862362 RepID=A0AAV9ZXP2_9AGAR